MQNTVTLSLFCHFLLAPVFDAFSLDTFSWPYGKAIYSFVYWLVFLVSPRFFLFYQIKISVPSLIYLATPNNREFLFTRTVSLKVSLTKSFHVSHLFTTAPASDPAQVFQWRNSEWWRHYNNVNTRECFTLNSVWGNSKGRWFTRFSKYNWNGEDT